jgi:2-iminobutanoate/2-iminopropanoate deaminase
MATDARVVEPMTALNKEPVERIRTAKAPQPAGHYSQATALRDLVFVSGQLGPRPDGQSTAGEPFEDQAKQSIANMLAILAEAGCGPSDVLKVTAYIVGVDNWPGFNRVFAECFGDAKPARSVVPVPELHLGYLIEVEAIARRAQRKLGEKT